MLGILMKATTFQAMLENELKNVSEQGHFSALSLSDESGLLLATVDDTNWTRLPALSFL